MSAVDQILSGYSAQSKEVLGQLKRILHHGALGGTGRLVILPVDQGVEHGPSCSFAKNPSGYNPEYHVQLAVQSGCSAYAAPLGFIESVSAKYARKIPLILKLNHSDSLYQSASAPISSWTASPRQAQDLGCCAVGFTIYPGSRQRKQQYEELAQASCEAKKRGLAVVVWSYPRGEGLSKQGETAVDVVSYAAHIACQLGAHIVKVKPPSPHIESPKAQAVFKSESIPFETLSDRVRHVVQSAFDGQRIVIFSGGAAKETKPFLEEIQQLKEGGAFGSIIGRNAFQRPWDKAVDLLKSVINIYKN